MLVGDRVLQPRCIIDVLCDRWLGGWCSTDQQLPASKLAVLDCTCELPLRVHGSPYLCLPTWDTYGTLQAPSHVLLKQAEPLLFCVVQQFFLEQYAALAAPTVEQIDLGVAWSLDQNRQGHGVYVHCAHGHGRSNVVLCAVLISVGAAGSIQEVRSSAPNRARNQCWP